MILLEGRKEDVYKKYQKSIDAERKFLSNYMDKASAYDFLLDEPFMKETNYKYLGDVLEHYYTLNEWSGEEEPTNIERARTKLFSIRSEITGLIEDFEIFEKHKSKFKYPDIKKYLPFLQEFFTEVKKIKEDIEKKKVEVASKKEIDRIFENDTLPSISSIITAFTSVSDSPKPSIFLPFICNLTPTWVIWFVCSIPTILTVVFGIPK